MDNETRDLPFDAAQAMAPAMALALSANFGSPQRWHDAFVALAAAHDGAGWVLLEFQPSDGKLVQHWAADAAPGTAGGVPILDIDLRASAPPHERVAGIDWAATYARYQEAVDHASAGFGAAQDEIDGALLVDVRRAAVFEQSPARIPGAEWRDPGEVGIWAATVPAGREVVVYCVYGHEVGRATALRLRAAGINARYLRGGIDGWQAAGRPLQDNGDRS